MCCCLDLQITGYAMWGPVALGVVIYMVQVIQLGGLQGFGLPEGWFIVTSYCRFKLLCYSLCSIVCCSHRTDSVIMPRPCSGLSAVSCCAAACRCTCGAHRTRQLRRQLLTVLTPLTNLFVPPPILFAAMGLGQARGGPGKGGGQAVMQQAAAEPLMRGGIPCDVHAPEGGSCPAAGGKDLFPPERRPSGRLSTPRLSSCRLAWLGEQAAQRRLPQCHLAVCAVYALAGLLCSCTCCSPNRLDFLAAKFVTDGNVSDASGYCLRRCLLPQPLLRGAPSCPRCCAAASEAGRLDI